MNDAYAELAGEDLYEIRPVLANDLLAVLKPLQLVIQVLCPPRPTGDGSCGWWMGWIRGLWVCCGWAGVCFCGW
jgi:hypothetical protein